jgi:hypothetical protein
MQIEILVPFAVLLNIIPDLYIEFLRSRQLPQLGEWPTSSMSRNCSSRGYRTKLRGLSPRANYTVRATAVGEVSAHFCG